MRDKRSRSACASPLAERAQQRVSKQRTNRVRADILRSHPSPTRVPDCISAALSRRGEGQAGPRRRLRPGAGSRRNAARARHRHPGLQRRPQHRADLGGAGETRHDAGAGADLLRPRRRRHAAGDPRQSPITSGGTRPQCRARRARRGDDRLCRKPFAVRVDVPGRRRHQRRDARSAWSRSRAKAATSCAPAASCRAARWSGVRRSRPRWCESGNFTLHHLARLPATDASNGFRLFSRRVIDEIVVESGQGFCYSIELLVKAHRLGWRIGEVPVRWFERRHGESRFRVLKWLPAYLRWYGYAFATTWLRKPPASVVRRAQS